MAEWVGVHYRTGIPICVKIRQGRIAHVEELTATAKEGLPWIAPGLVDLQINGYGGHDLNALPLDETRVIRVTRGLWKEGVTTFFPTIVTNHEKAIEDALRRIAFVCSRDEEVGRCIAGIHLEGPFISPEEGPRGAHPREYVREPDWVLFRRWQEAAEGRIKILTLSPEWPGAAEFIRRCSENGVIVSIGHTAATSEQIREAVRAGARMSTHLGNGAHLMLPRHPNYLWEQLAQDELWSCMISDGFHLPESVLKVIMKVKGERALLVSDAVSFSGLKPGEYTSHIGGKVVLTSGGKLHLAENPNLLAGSAQPLKWGIQHLTKTGLCSMSDAWEMASLRPARLVNLPVKDGLVQGAPADLVLFQKGMKEIQIRKTVKHGECVYSSH